MNFLFLKHTENAFYIEFNSVCVRNNINPLTPKHLISPRIITLNGDENKGNDH